MTTSAGSSPCAALGRHREKQAPSGASRGRVERRPPTPSTAGPPKCRRLASSLAKRASSLAVIDSAQGSDGGPIRGHKKIRDAELRPKACFPSRVGRRSTAGRVQSDLSVVPLVRLPCSKFRTPPRPSTVGYNLPFLSSISFAVNLCF
jgi:hypothetical protein